MNRTTEWSIRQLCKRARTSQMSPIKLIINANSHDRRPLRQLLFSLLSVGYSQWSDTIIVTGGGGVDRPPTRQLVSECAGVTMDRTGIGPGPSLVTVHVAETAFDYHAFNALWQHRDNQLISAQGYIYTVDTTLVHPGFPKRFFELGKNFQRAESKQCSMHVHTVPLPNANICAFGVGVLFNYGTNFAIPNLTKREAVEIEKDCVGSRGLSLVHFARSVVMQRPRQSCGHYDVYTTRQSPRLCWYYDTLHLLKFHDARTLM